MSRGRFRIQAGNGSNQPNYILDEVRRHRNSWGDEVSTTDDRDYLREELQRRRRDLDYDEYVAATQMQRRIRNRRTVAFIIGLSSFALALYALLFRDLEYLRLPLVLGVVLAFTGFALVYLQPSTTPGASSSDAKTVHRLRYYIDERLAEATQKLRESGAKDIAFSSEDKATILASIQAKLESEALQKYVEGIRELVLARVHDESLDERLQSTRNRLGREIQDLAKRGNLNLILGILTTLGGLSVLGYAVFNLPATLDASELLSYFVPRVSLVILIEVFAYFFLRLYKQSLAEIKYFQNELTNVESKQLALHIALRSDDTALRSKVVEELAGTERNLILTKDQTTVELERERIAHEAYAGVTDVIREVVKKKEGT